MYLNLYVNVISLVYLCLTLTWDVFKSQKTKKKSINGQRLTLTWDVFK